MTNAVFGGSFIVARKLFASDIWTRPPLYLKLFLWIIGQANHANRQEGQTLYRRGDFSTTYEKIINALSYRENRRVISPTIKQVRLILAWLQAQGMIVVSPIRKNQLPNRGRPMVQTGAYLGLLISVVNYDTYQVLEAYKGRDKGRPSAELGQNNKNDKQKDIFRQNALDVLAYLNEKTGRRYRDTSFIEARLKDGGTVDDCKRIVDTKIKDPYFQENPKYLNPETLFRKTHWDKYVNESSIPRRDSGW